MQGSLTHHIQSVPEIVKYDCNQCDYRGTMLSNLSYQIKSLYELFVLCANNMVHYVLSLEITYTESDFP